MGVYRRHRRGSQAQRRGVTATLLIAPAVIIYGVFFIVPLVQTAYLSFTDWNGVRSTINFIGLDNYTRMFDNPLFWRSLRHTVIWVVVGTIAPIAISLGLGMLLWPNTRGQSVFQLIFFLPQILSTVAIGLIWAQIYSPVGGLLNESLRAVGLDSIARGWLGDPTWALWAVLVAAVWGFFGFSLVVIMAGLRNVDLDLVDAAAIDGAGAWLRFRHVVVPQLRSVLTFVTAFTLIGGFNVFDIIWVTTRGGPANSTEVLATNLWKRAFVENDVAFGAALAMVLALISLAASVIFVYLRERVDVGRVAHV